jgi:hypothetical protein
MVTGPGAFQDAQESELSRAVALVAAVWQVTVLIQVIIYASAFRHPALSFAVWLGLLGAAVWLLPRAGARGLTGAESAGAIAIAVAAVAAIGWDRRLHGAAGSVDWSVVGTAWLLAIVAVSRPAWEWISGALLVFAAHAVFVIRILSVTSLGLARLAVTVYSLAVILVVFAALRPTWRTEARMAARRALLASRSAAERAAAAAVAADQHGRLALLEMEALPLLRGIAEGEVDPDNWEVMQRCARHAAALRNALIDSAPDPGGLLAGLAPAMRIAEARGVLVEVQVVADPGRPAPEVVRATAAAVGRVLTELPPQQTILTVVGSAQDVELYLIFGTPPRGRPDLSGLDGRVLAGARWRATVDLDDSGTGCLEVRWHEAMPGATTRTGSATTDSAA